MYRRQQQLQSSQFNWCCSTPYAYFTQAITLINQTTAETASSDQKAVQVVSESHFSYGQVTLADFTSHIRTVHLDIIKVSFIHKLMHN